MSYMASVELPFSVQCNIEIVQSFQDFEHLSYIRSLYTLFTFTIPTDIHFIIVFKKVK